MTEEVLYFVHSTFRVETPAAAAAAPPRSAAPTCSCHPLRRQAVTQPHGTADPGTHPVCYSLHKCLWKQMEGQGVRETLKLNT